MNTVVMSNKCSQYAMIILTSFNHHSKYSFTDSNYHFKADLNGLHTLGTIEPPAGIKAVSRADFPQ